MRRCPFSVDIDGGVQVALMRDAADSTGPDPITEREMLGDVMTRGTPFGAGTPAAHMLYQHARLRGHMVQNGDKAGKAQVRYLAAPQRFHAPQVQGFQGNHVILLTQLVGQLPVKPLADMGGVAVDTRQVPPGLVPIVLTLTLAGQLPVGFR